MSGIKLSIEDCTARITLSKPPLNILGINDFRELNRIFKELSENDKLKLILIDSDQKIFSAGVDVSEHSKDKIKALLESFHSVFYSMIKLKIPTISLVQSGCFGGGFELALFCDLTLISENAVFSHPEIKLGCYPPVSIVNLPLMIGGKRTLELLFTGKRISAAQALDFGLVNHVFKEEDFQEQSQLIINDILAKSSSVIKTTISAYKQIHHFELKEKLELSEKIYLHELVALKDSQEGVKSFMEKRFPVWKDK